MAAVVTNAADNTQNLQFDHDLYPTRLDQPIDWFRRRDPVVHAERRARAEGPLSRLQVEEWRRKGFLAFPGFFRESEVSDFLDEFRAMERDTDLLSQDYAFTEPGSNELRSVFDMHRLSERVDRLTRDPRLLDIVHQLLGSDVYIHQSRINYKPGFKGKGFSWHSDFETWHAEDGMPRMRCLSCSILLTENNEFNGPLMLVPGSHEFFLPAVGRTPESNWESSLKDQTIGVPPEVAIHAMIRRGGIEAPKGPAGSVLFFECNTLHGSNANMSPFPRSNLFFVYNSVENRLQAPFCGRQPRPEWLGARTHAPALTRP